MGKIIEKQKTEETYFDYDAYKIKTDKDLEKKVLNALQANSFINSTKIKVKVYDCRVFLEGTVLLKIERSAAQKSIEDIFGVVAVINYITFPYQQPG